MREEEGELSMFYVVRSTHHPNQGKLLLENFFPFSTTMYGPGPGANVVKLWRLPITSLITTNSNNGERRWPTSVCASHKSVGMSHLADNLPWEYYGVRSPQCIFSMLYECLSQLAGLHLLPTCHERSKINTSDSKNEGMRSVMDSLTDKVRLGNSR